MQYRLPSLLALMIALSPAWAQQSDGKLSDAERAKRDAEKVFSFIKFHTVKPATPPAPAAKPAVPAPARPAASPAVARSSGSNPPPAAQAAAGGGRQMAGLGSRSAEAEAAPQLQQPGGSAPASLPLPPTQPEPVPAAATAVEEPEEEVALKLIAYTAPEMSAPVLAAMNDKPVVVPVRFTVQPDGSVSAAQAMGNAPRRVANAAVRAVQQWRFDPIPAQREVDVEIAFKAE